ncbi:hypothetical protein HPB47_003662 [Ixodes persulcatus]|uniref:Uncharacterized protein n=1 Tax=Ixodes persulcatus TaxID=34615 RepID=A0AC60PHU2_IXOPE|nr:hypothetical protein HPB47_003662 [Ixodes persulcatus]
MINGLRQVKTYLQRYDGDATKLFPVTMSMIASFLSAIAMLGVPAENFVHGSQYLMNTVGVVVGIVLSAEVFMPVFYDMEMISVNQACMMLGGVSPVFTIADQQGILKFFDFSFDFQKTFTFWSVVIGSCVIWTMTFCTNQTMVQRYCGLSSASKARKALYTNMAGVSGLLSLASFCGLALFALYHKCDPVKAGIITKYDQLMPHFVMDTLNHLPGLSGLFVTAVYSGSLSTMSSGYNALAAITWEDFLKPRLNLSPTGVMRATKIIAASYGLLAILVAFLSGTIPSILQATFITSGAVGGASGAVFFIGLLLPWCGSKTALASMITGMCTASWVAIGSLIYPKRPVAAHTSLEGCAFNYTLQAPDPVEYRSGGGAEEALTQFLDRSPQALAPSAGVARLTAALLKASAGPAHWGRQVRRAFWATGPCTRKCAPSFVLVLAGDPEWTAACLE